MEEGFLPGDALAELPAFRSDRVELDPVARWKDALLRRSWAHFGAHATPQQTHRARGLPRRARARALARGVVALRGAPARLRRPSMDRLGGRPQPPGSRRAASGRRARSRARRSTSATCSSCSSASGAGSGRAPTRDIRIVGDVPIYVADDSADVWSHPELFDLDDGGARPSVAGVPPDYFSKTGQLWGNPLYRWDRPARDGYAGGSPASRPALSCRPRPPRSLSRLRGLLVGARLRRHRAERPLDAGTREGALRRPRRARRAPAGGRGPRLHHGGRAHAAARLRYRG